MRGFPVKAFDNFDIDHGLRVHLHGADQFGERLTARRRVADGVTAARDHAVASAVLVQTEDMAGAFAAVQPAAFQNLSCSST